MDFFCIFDGHFQKKTEVLPGGGGDAERTGTPGGNTSWPSSDKTPLPLGFTDSALSE